MTQVKDIILKKRQGGEHAPEELRELLEGYLSGSIKDYQISAWLMAIYFRGLSANETQMITELLLKSGDSLTRTDRNEFWVDKHSTGGVGDKTSLLLVPLVHSVGERLLGSAKLKVPMISGRGLGCTGGTLDKLESVPGFSANISIPSALSLLKRNGFFMMGQTDRLAPLDRVLYALRDATATVENRGLIVASIMSKKLAESLDGLVLDVKYGKGAFMATLDDARALAHALVETGKRNRVDTVAVLSSMNEPLGHAVGNQLEVEECSQILQGNTGSDPSLIDVTVELASWMLHLASRRTVDRKKALEECRLELASGKAFDTFKGMFMAQGGDWNRFQQSLLSSDCLEMEWKSPTGGFVAEINASLIGKLVNEIGGGRDAKEDPIDPRVGVICHSKVGDKIKSGETVVRVYYRHERDRARIERALEKTVRITPNPTPKTVWLHGTIE